MHTKNNLILFFGGTSCDIWYLSTLDQDKSDNIESRYKIIWLEFQDIVS